MNDKMKEFDATNKNGKNGTMRVIAKKGQTMDVARHEFSQDTASLPFENLSEKMAHILRGMHVWQATFQHQLDRWTFGAFSRFGGMIFVKVLILAIIMYQILHEPVASIENTVTFAGRSGNPKEKTQNDNQKQKANNTTASLGGGVSFDLSPASVEELKAPDVKSYIETFSRASIAEMDKFGIPASITMAQAIIESRSGTSVLSVRNNNHFGIKCFSKSCPKGHCSNYTDDHHKDFFRMYSTKEGSWRAHSEFLLTQARYKGLLQYGKNYKLWALKLREFGYATDPTYDKKLIGIIEKYELYKLDDL
jgi:flagellum-specific peptidoglycan hydrolase FlgJ